VDEETALHSRRSKNSFVSRGSFKLKGKNTAVNVFEPRALAPKSTRMPSVRSDSEHQLDGEDEDKEKRAWKSKADEVAKPNLLIGRTTEIDRIMDGLNDYVESGKPCRFYVEGSTFF
jgi:hypothetical protein